MKPTLKGKAISASFWSGLDTLSRYGLQFCVTLILARLLTPNDYGTVALLAIFIGLVGVFIESGFSSALIQRKEVTEVDISSVFYFNVCMALLASIALCAASPWIAKFYNTPILRPLLWLMAANLFIGAFGSIQRTLLTKALNFRRQCLISLAAVLISGSVAVVLAWRGWGVWSLGIQTITATSVSVLLLWYLSSWRPRLLFSMLSIRSLFRFGGFLLLSGLLDILFTRLNTLVIGKFYSPRDLGYYSRADETSLGPAAFLTTTISRVAFPIFSSVHDDYSLLRAALRRAITTTMMINIPVMLGMAVTSKSLVLLLFGSQWIQSAPYLAILCLGGILWPLHVLNLYALMAQGHSNLYFRLEIIKKILGICIIGTACFFGIIAIAWSTVAVGLLSFGINAHYSGKLLNYGPFHQAADLYPYAGAGVLMAACVWAVALLPIRYPFLLLLAQVASGTAAYGLACFLADRKHFASTIHLFIQCLPLKNANVRQ